MIMMMMKMMMAAVMAEWQRKYPNPKTDTIAIADTITIADANCSTKIVSCTIQIQKLDNKDELL